MNERLTGLRSVGAGPRGSVLYDGGVELASVSFTDGKWYNDSPGWYFVARNDELYIPYKNTCHETVTTEKEAKEQARNYIDECLKLAKKAKI